MLSKNYFLNPEKKYWQKKKNNKQNKQKNITILLDPSAHVIRIHSLSIYSLKKIVALFWRLSIGRLQWKKKASNVERRNDDYVVALDLIV